MRSKLAPFLMALVAAGLGGCGSSDDDGPVADFTSDCIEFVCEFDASASYSPQGRELSYVWVFGDGGGASTETAEHFYATPGEYEVTLQVTDAGGNRDTTTQMVNPTGNPAIDYFVPLQATLSSMIFLAESAKPVIKVGDNLQDQVEAEGAPGKDGYEVACLRSGTADILSWDDADTSGTVNGNEAVTLTASNCKTGAGIVISSSSSFEIVSDFDSNDFSIAMPTDVGSGIKTDLADSWYLRGPVSYQATRSGSTITSLRQTSADLNLVFRQQNTADFFADISHDLTSDFGVARNISGSMSIKPGPGASAFPIDLTIDSNITIEEANGDLSLASGSMTLLRDGETIVVDVAADPAYLRIRVDENSNGTFEINARFPQRITVKRLE